MTGQQWQRYLINLKSKTMKSNTLISVRSNTNFSIDYKTGLLTPQLEVILITTSPKYTLTKKGDGFTKTMDIQEYRFLSCVEGINNLIGQLKMLLDNAVVFDQMASSFNTVIKSYESSKTK